MNIQAGQDFVHETVLRRELVDALNLKLGDIAVDCTIGGGGHTAGLLEAVGPSGKVIGIDRDDRALAATGKRLEAAVGQGRLKLIKGRFSEIVAILTAEGLIHKVAGICADIGVSSPQLDQAERGFSFANDGPLDMRMDQADDSVTAETLIATAGESELARIFFEYGEEPKSRIVARRIVEARERQPIKTTAQLASLVERALRYPERSRKHPATKVFQALRIAVNGELEELASLVRDGFEALKEGGRFGIISFHSLEDRIVKQMFSEISGKHDRQKIPRDLPMREDELKSLLKTRATLIKPWPMEPSEEEATRNPRARSAKLRVLEKAIPATP